MKTKNIIRVSGILFLGLLTMVSCRKEGCTDEKAINYNEDAKKDDSSCEYKETGTVELKMDHRWGNMWSAFSMNQEMTHPGTGEKMTFQTLNYYISNVRLKREDGSWWTQPESYYLVKVDENSVPTIDLKNVPNGRYTDIQYTIGVDSTRNVSGAQTGALDPSHGMFWNWNSGYIFIKAEGVSPDSPNGGFTYHLGGFRESNNTNALRTNSNNFGGSTLVVDGDNGSPSIHFYVNTARFWHGGISLEDINTVHMPGQNAITLADNFAGAFVVDHIH
jgi:hypothetical protein